MTRARSGSLFNALHLMFEQQYTELAAAVDLVADRIREGQPAVARTARHVFPLAEPGGDQVTTDFLTRRLEVRENNAWMLRSRLEA